MGHFAPFEIIYAPQVKASNCELAFSHPDVTVTCPSVIFKKLNLFFDFSPT